MIQKSYNFLYQRAFWIELNSTMIFMMIPMSLILQSILILAANPKKNKRQKLLRKSNYPKRRERILSTGQIKIPRLRLRRWGRSSKRGRSRGRRKRKKGSKGRTSKLLVNCHSRNGSGYNMRHFWKQSRKSKINLQKMMMRQVATNSQNSMSHQWKLKAGIKLSNLPSTWRKIFRKLNRSLMSESSSTLKWLKQNRNLKMK